MRTSVTFRPSPANKRRRPFAGFTLLEILLVLAIMALLAGIVLPQLQTMASRVEIANQRTDIRSSIEGLGYRAYAGGKQIVLAGSYGANAKDAANAAPPFKLPDGWRVQITDPVRYSVNGVCSGGKLVVVAPDRTREAFALKPPRCHLEPVEARE